MRRILAAMCLFALVVHHAKAQEIALADQAPATLSVWGGEFDSVQRRNSAAEFGAEYRSSTMLWYLQPMAGVMHTANGATDAFAGVGIDVVLWDHLLFRPSFAPSLYARGNAKDLGGSVQFRSAAELAYRFDDDQSLGATFYHLSNAGLASKDPGEQSLVVIYTLPVTTLAGLFSK